MTGGLKAPSSFVPERDLGEVIEKLLEKDNVNIFVLNNDKKVLQTTCSRLNEKEVVLLELDKENNPCRIMCPYFENEHESPVIYRTNFCSKYQGNKMKCFYTKWEEINKNE